MEYIFQASFCTFFRFSVAADGPGDRFIMGESQAGQQVTSNTPTLREPNIGWYAVFYFFTAAVPAKNKNTGMLYLYPHFNTSTAQNTAETLLNKQ